MGNNQQTVLDFRKILSEIAAVFRTRERGDQLISDNQFDLNQRLDEDEWELWKYLNVVPLESQAHIFEDFQDLKGLRNCNIPVQEKYIEERHQTQ